MANKMSVSNIASLVKRELVAYLATPVAYVFVVIFIMLTAVFTFYVGHFYKSNQADLVPFFSFHPWLYLFLIPALAMRLWAEERKSGTIEVLLTLPVHLFDVVIAKFLAAWVMCGAALALTFPLWITVSYLGDPDHGVIVASYIGSWLMAGAFLAIGSCMSALTANQVIAFILTVVVCFLFVVAGSPIVIGIFQQPNVPLFLLDVVSSLSVLSHFDAISKGVLALQDLVYFVVMIVAWLFATSVIIELKKAD